MKTTAVYITHVSTHTGSLCGHLEQTGLLDSFGYGSGGRRKRKLSLRSLAAMWLGHHQHFKVEAEQTAGGQRFTHMRLFLPRNGCHMKYDELSLIPLVRIRPTETRRHSRNASTHRKWYLLVFSASSCWFGKATLTFRLIQHVFESDSEGNMSRTDTIHGQQSVTGSLRHMVMTSGLGARCRSTKQAFLSLLITPPSHPSP